MKPQKRRWILGILILISALLSIGGQRHAGADERITYRLKWLENMSTVGDLYAAEQGYFRDQGLEVTVKPGGPERDAIRELELGYADFGVASADQVIRALAKGSPVMVVAQLFQVNPLQWIYRRDRLSIAGLGDLRGKTIGVTFGKNDEMILRALLSDAGIRDTQVRLYGVRLDYSPFYKGLADLWPVYINTQGVEIGGRLRAAGESVGFLNPADYGVRFVANSVVTSSALVNNQPEIVKRFLRALLKGWCQAVDPVNKDLAVAVVQRFDRDSTPQVLQQQLTITRTLVKPSAERVIGAIDTSAWRQTERIMLKHHQIAAPVNVVERLKPMLE